jgi:hypothetical protein
MERDKKLAKHEIKKKEYNLDKTICSPTAKYTDYYIDGVTYRVWSAFEGETSAEDSLTNLMLRKMESNENVGEIEDEYENAIEQIENESMVML